ncbi:hypothetical protein TVAG_240730 [Trichomonas vaginalis G3]|uniref:RRM domain-containing protein n=1 Tax=Trichomonas vaginalis (strain ATCC PRA-98 / G3) TaxID=412133 RepID=A2EJC0_TRIV3|nr:RNA-binding domain, RBD family-containing protein [Trichomonas vaginalis G3]EAY07272.1 hypothetical protein TVAG_240730 [Trichomonas vaginalis G3]KAI5511956.1 RNA-binding domain, RBD family-containing protein [Trichomonas vaginalis G3]|eukprot:XP_001319495.1 hypothetical protein [Trichomonas vaginalis G3]
MENSSSEFTPIEIIDNETKIADLPENVRKVTQDQVLFVKGITKNITNEEFIKFFQKSGRILAYKINKNDTGADFYIAYVAFERKHDALDAYNNLDRTPLMGKRIKLLWSEKNFITRENFGVRNDPRKVEKYTPPSNPQLRDNMETKRAELLRLVQHEIETRYKIKAEQERQNQLPEVQYDRPPSYQNYDRQYHERRDNYRNERSEPYNDRRSYRNESQEYSRPPPPPQDRYDREEYSYRRPEREEYRNYERPPERKDSHYDDRYDYKRQPSREEYDRTERERYHRQEYHRPRTDDYYNSDKGRPR